MNYAERHAAADRAYDPEAKIKAIIARYLADKPQVQRYFDTHDIDMITMHCRRCGKELREIHNWRLRCLVHNAAV